MLKVIVDYHGSIWLAMLSIVATTMMIHYDVETPLVIIANVLILACMRTFALWEGAYRSSICAVRVR